MHTNGMQNLIQYAFFYRAKHSYRNVRFPYIESLGLVIEIDGDIISVILKFPPQSEESPPVEQID